MAEKRLRTAYIQRHRYRQISRSLAVAGGVIGAGIVGLALAQAYAEGESVPAASWVVGLAIIAISAFVPWALVRWRWRNLRQTLVDERD